MRNTLSNPRYENPEADRYNPIKRFFRKVRDTLYAGVLIAALSLAGCASPDTIDMYQGTIGLNIDIKERHGIKRAILRDETSKTEYDITGVISGNDMRLPFSEDPHAFSASDGGGHRYRMFPFNSRLPEDHNYTFSLRDSRGNEMKVKARLHGEKPFIFRTQHR